MLSIKIVCFLHIIWFFQKKENGSCFEGCCEARFSFVYLVHHFLNLIFAMLKLLFELNYVKQIRFPLSLKLTATTSGKAHHFPCNISLWFAIFRIDYGSLSVFVYTTSTQHIIHAWIFMNYRNRKFFSDKNWKLWL